jgi:hypothetical protein
MAADGLSWGACCEEGEMRMQAGPDCVLRISCSLRLIRPVQERVDTGTVFCPVVVASQGSSLNHSA